VPAALAADRRRAAGLILAGAIWHSKRQKTELLVPPNEPESPEAAEITSRTS
jgi:hypothetical protein